MENKFKKMIETNKKPLGIFSEMASPNVIEALGYAGIDYVIIDNEHSPIAAETSQELIRACELTGLTPICRVQDMHRSAFLKLLDVGAQGIIVPNLKTVEEAKQLVKWTKYVPIGERGFSGSRKDCWGLKYNFTVPETMEFYNNQTLLIPQCETKEALEAIEEITKIEGIDGIFVGPFDLSISMGIPGEFDNPLFKDAIRKIIDACHKNKKFVMIYGGSKDVTIQRYNEGFDAVAYSFDVAFMCNSLKEQAKEIKEKING